MFRLLRVLILTVCLLPAGASMAQNASVPLPEHPHPDWERPQWLNLNGAWDFRFDPDDLGLSDGWATHADGFDRRITVPFPWGSPRSGVPDSADIGWYARSVTVPPEWVGHRVFVVFGASDWHTTLWLDGHELGAHRGGYTPFEFEITDHVRPGEPIRLVARVDDTPHDFKLEGKQGYGPARGFWQTVYLEARGADPVRQVHVRPDPGLESATVDVVLQDAAPYPVPFELSFPNGEREPVSGVFAPGVRRVEVPVPLPGARRWSLDDPYLHWMTVRVGVAGRSADEVRTYFGMRSISVGRLPGTTIPYVALNGRPVYLQLTLDQAYHPEGYYTFPSDEVIRQDVERARDIGLNGLRVHVKVAQPRKLYWADRLGMLVMADVPNSWGEPGPEMRAETEYALRAMIRRDFNHPSIFAWIVFNETWGLYSRVEEGGEERRAYLPDTKAWVVDLVREVRGLDPTRLVEDNSVCCGVGHTETDLNSWHAYLPGWAWPGLLDEIAEGIRTDSSWNYEPGYVRTGDEPVINSEFGNVWGYEGSTGDVDWSWDYHRAVNAFREHPEIAGWLYTEHHDVINEWNGYWRYDRGAKETGLGDLVPGMSLRDLHAPLYVVVGAPDSLSREVAAGETVRVALTVSNFGEERAMDGTLRWRLTGRDFLGRSIEPVEGSRHETIAPWQQGPLESVAVRMPDRPGLAVLAVTVEDRAGTVLHRNFQTFVVAGERPTGSAEERYLYRDVADASSSTWTGPTWEVLDGLKVSATGSGHLEYRFAWPADVVAGDVVGARFVVEASAKQLFDKDRVDVGAMGGDYMRGGGTHSPHRNPNAYPMTDDVRWPGTVTVLVNGVEAGIVDLPDDPADHRGVLSWHAQLKDRRLREAGSYGYLVDVPVPPVALERAARDGALVVRLEVPPDAPGGLALYGRSFGRYPVDPTLVLTLGR